jgi:hypothetical protein
MRSCAHGSYVNVYAETKLAYLPYAPRILEAKCAIWSAVVPGLAEVARIRSHVHITPICDILQVRAALARETPTFHSVR